MTQTIGQTIKGGEKISEANVKLGTKIIQDKELKGTKPNKPIEKLP